MKTHFKNITLIIVILFLGNCTSPTKPNQSVIYQIKLLDTNPPATKEQKIKSAEIPNEIQEYLISLYNLDAELSLEIGRLPEYQNDISPDAEKALKRFFFLIKNASDEEINSFKAVINEGIPEVRKFCAPLQAIIWLLEKDEIYYKFEILNLSLDEILYTSWKFKDQHWDGKGLSEVTDRLTSPRLISHYVKANFTYLSKNEVSHTAQDAISIFARKKGNCKGYADFQCQCLKKAGYDAQRIRVKSPDNSPYHAVCEFRDKDGIIYIIDNSLPFLVNGIVEKDIYTTSLPQIR